MVGSDVIGEKGTHLLADGSLNLRSVRGRKQAYAVRTALLGGMQGLL